MADEPSSNDRRSALLIFAVIVILALIATIYFMGDATQEVEQADEPEEEPNEDVNSHMPVLPAEPLYGNLG